LPIPDKRASAIEELRQAISYFEFCFFTTIRRSGVVDGAPEIELWNGHRLVGYSDHRTSYYEAVFAKHAAGFSALNVVPEAYGAAFDAMISYHYENSSPILRSAFLRRGLTVLDIGVRGGHWCVKAADLVGAAGRVIGVDPTDFAEKHLGLHVVRNGLTNVSLWKHAVGRKDGERREFFSGSNGETYSGLYQTTHDQNGKRVVNESHHHGHTVIVTRTIDSLVNERKLDRVDMMVFQINGAEFEALSGCSETIRRFMPIILTNAHQQTEGGNFDTREKIDSFLHEHRYQILIQDDCQILAVPQAITDDRNHQRRTRAVGAAWATRDEITR
jgi:FkbM family methyltransferase